LSNTEAIRSSQLDVFFQPKSVAVIGASESAGSVGRIILWNLISSPFGGTVYPVNPKRASILGIRAYPNVAALPEPVELAVIITRADAVPATIRECATAGVKGAVIISAGFRETGPRGVQLEEEILRDARAAGMRLIGPNCLGVMCPVTGFNATFAHTIARSGNVAFISQSGAMCTAILDWSLREKVGFSAFVSVGSMLDVGWGNLIDHLGDDPHTRSIVIYMESVGEAASFLSAAREVALSKPIIVIKAGRTEAAAKAAASHTGSLSGSDEVLEAAFRRVGVLRLNSISEIFYMTEVLAKQPRPEGPKLAIVTNAGGPGVLATDALLSMGGELAKLAPETSAALDKVLPAHWSRNNPIDVIGDADPERYEHAIQIVAKDPEVDGLLVIMTPQGVTAPTAIAQKVCAYAKLGGKPILASWMGGTETAEGERLLNEAGIPTFPFPDTAARMFAYMWKYSYNLRALYETPAPASAGSVDRQGAALLLENVRAQSRELLTEAESKDLLKAYGIPVVQTTLAATEAEAVAAAEAMGFPVVLKLNSATITHKTDVGGVKLNLFSATAVAEAFRSIHDSVAENAGAEHFQGVSVQPMIRQDGYELILGSSVDPQFGPVLLFGTGGQLVEVFRDRALALPPLNTTLARRMMEQTRILTALKGIRGRPPVDIAALEQILVRFGQLITEQRSIREVDINPLFVSHQTIIALDARVIVYPKEVTAENLPRTAIRPYPAQYEKRCTLGDGSEISIRPIRPEDEPLLVQFHEGLSDRTVYLRYFHWMKLEQRVEHERLTRMCFLDFNRQMAFLALAGDVPQIVGVGRLVRFHVGDEAELAVIVNDEFQRRGIGVELIRQLLEFARDEEIHTITATLLRENTAMHKVFKRLGFTFRDEAGDEALVAELKL
jgi:acetyltransferase